MSSRHTSTLGAKQIHGIGRQQHADSMPVSMLGLCQAGGRPSRDCTGTLLLVSQLAVLKMRAGSWCWASAEVGLRL